MPEVLLILVYDVICVDPPLSAFDKRFWLKDKAMERG
jgi:hypothetical protein